MSLRPMITPDAAADIWRFLIFCRIRLAGWKGQAKTYAWKGKKCHKLSFFTSNCEWLPKTTWGLCSAWLSICGIFGQVHNILVQSKKIYLVEERRVGHGHPGHLVVFPVDAPSWLRTVGHPHLLGERLDVRHRGSIDLKLLWMTCVRSVQWINITSLSWVQSTVQSRLSVPFVVAVNQSKPQTCNFQCRF